MKSIRGRLFLILMVTTGLVWLSAIGWIYLSTQAKVEKVLDARLVEAARMVSSLVASQGMDPAKAAEFHVAIAEPHPLYDRQLSCQIWAFDGTLVGRSSGAPGTPLTETDEGFSETRVHGETWRVYAVADAERGMRVMVGDNLSVRDRLVADVIRGLALPAIVALLALSGLIWFSVGRGLAPLNAMARALANRPASDLSPLTQTGSPSEIRPMVDALNGLFARVGALRQRERDFTAFAAHELKTPIAGLRTQAQIALGAGEGDVRGNALEQIVVGVDRTSRLIRQLTDLTNAENGDEAGQGETVNPGQMLELLADDIHRHKTGSVAISIAPELHETTLAADPFLFSLAARNLLENAAMHSTQGGRVRCTLHRQDDSATVMFEDDGPGIPDDELSKVRDRFFRGRNKTPMGSGLGLAIAELAMKRMGGALHIANRDEGGLRTEMEFRLSVKNDT